MAEISQVTIRKDGIKIRLVAGKFSIFSSESVNTLCKYYTLSKTVKLNRKVV